MRKRLCAALAAMMVLGAMPLMAQNGPAKGACSKMTPESFAKHRTEQLTESLHLTSQQQDAVYRLTLDGARQCKAKCDAMQSTGQTCDVAAVKQACDEGMAAKDAAMKKILTAEQYAKWKKMCSERNASMCDKKKHKGEHDAMNK